MAPPQVDLNKKQPLEDVQGWAEVVGEKKLPPLPPITPSAPPVAVETGTRVGGRRMLGKKRCKKVVIGMIIGAIIATAITVGAFMAHRHFHHDDDFRGHVKDGEHHADEYIRIKGAKHLIYVARNATDYFFEMNAVLDYRTQLAGFKDCGKKRCYVDRLHESYDDGCRRWRHYSRHARTPKMRPLLVGPQIDDRVLNYIAGHEIYQLCGTLPSFWVIEIEQPQDDDLDGHHGDSSSHESSEETAEYIPDMSEFPPGTEFIYL